MAARYRTIERDQMMFLPPDLREWIAAGDIVYFIIEAAAMVPLADLDTNQMGTGEEQYHPHMRLALLLYCYSHGTFGSRRIERARWKDVSARYICGGKHHPDHDTICAFRVKNEKAIGQAFLRVLKLAREMGVLKVGTVSVDGTKIKANASIHKSLRYDRAGQLEAQLKLEIQELMAKAREAETNEPRDQEELVGELQRLDTLREKMRKAQEALEKRAKDNQKPKKSNKDDPNRKAPFVWRKPWVIGMRKLLESERGQQIYKLRKQSVEPVFGIIKAIYRSPGHGVQAVPTTWTGKDQSGMVVGHLCLQSEKVGRTKGLSAKTGSNHRFLVQVGAPGAQRTSSIAP